jgi:amino-acid N-acetyltransferase
VSDVLEPATAADLAEIRSLLERVHLPSSDVGGPHQRFVVARSGSELVGCAALEVHGATALLRSLAVIPARQGLGLGTALYERIMREGAAFGVEQIYLLTTTAEPFFARAGFVRTPRDDVPEAIRRTTEFTALCPATAVCMRRAAWSP